MHARTHTRSRARTRDMLSSMLGWVGKRPQAGKSLGQEAGEGARGCEQPLRRSTGTAQGIKILLNDLDFTLPLCIAHIQNGCAKRV